MPIPAGQLPKRVTIAPRPPIPGPAIAALSMLATVGIMGVLLGLGPWSGPVMGESAATSNVSVAGGYSGSRFGPSAEVALIALATRYAETPATTPEPGPLAVWLADAPPPTREPTHSPATATIAAQLTAVALIAATATAEARPKPCSVSPSGRVCFWPTETPLPEPTWTPLPSCITPVPGERCIR